MNRFAATPFVDVTALVGRERINPNELRARRAEYKKEAENLIDAAMSSGKDLTGTTLKKYEMLVGNIKEINGALERHESGGSGVQPVSATTPGTQTVGAALRDIHARAFGADREQIDSFLGYMTGNPISALADLRPANDGGFFIPTLVAGLLARNYAAFAPVRNAATIWPTEDGDPTVFPVISDSEAAAILLPSAATGADATVSGNTPPTSITGPLMGAFKFSSKPVLVPRETQTDASLNVLEEVLSALLSRIIRYQNLKFTKGSGTNEPTGFITSATSYAAGAVALDLDIALDLAYSVPAMYRPNGIYMATDTTIKYLRKLKTGLSGDKRGLWKDAFEDGNASQGVPAKLHGYPIIVNPDMDSVATDGTFAGVSPLAFGDYKRFIVRDAEMGVPYIYRYQVPATDGTGVIAFQRSDSRLVVPTAISKLTVS